MHRPGITQGIAALLSLLFLLSCASLQMGGAPDGTLHAPPDQLHSKIVTVLEKPPLEYTITKAAKGKIRAQKEYPGDPYGLPFLRKQMRERASLAITLVPSRDRSGHTDLYIRVTLEESEPYQTRWETKYDSDKEQEIISTLLQKLEGEL